MSRKKVAINFLLRDKKSIVPLIVSMAVTYTAIFLIFNVCFLDELQAGSSIENFKIGVVIMGTITLVAYLAWYMNIVSMKGRRKEIGVELISGVSRFDALGLSVTQLYFISGIAIVLGAVGFVILTPLVNFIVEMIVGSDIKIFSLSMMGMGTAGLVIAIQLLFVFFVNGGKSYRYEIIDLFKAEKYERAFNTKSFEIGIIAVLSLLAMGSILVIIPYGIMGNIEKISEFMAAIDNVSTGGLIIFILCGLPYFIELGIKKKYRFDYKKLIIAKSVKDLVTSSIFLVLGFAFIRFVVASTFIFAEQSKKTLAIGVIGASLMLIIAVIAYIYKLVFELEKRMEGINTLDQLGYRHEELKLIINKELFLYFIFVAVIPLIQSAIFLYGLQVQGIISTMVVFGFCGAYALLVTIGYIISIKIYNDKLKKLKVCN
ncbi:MAG: hypothetical protein ACRDDL_00355 [Sarcina sp.]